MRLRNIPRAKGVLEDSSIVIKEEEKQQGKWSKLFGNTQPIYIELGMGKGQFITAHAINNPEINYVGVERYTSVLLRSVERLQKEELDQKLLNLKLICMDAMNLNHVFAVDEIDRIYLNFSDPWPK
ncbi:MAG TPA: tRNA (guanosine(46)-N7)-methyltransferase TrmB, partial [Candidatus Dorea intestinavium]|nr:tRNA (guanosine(46)-N7)-methyltransferase TrmB [Candidatus Dorea intestinavium]